MTPTRMLEIVRQEATEVHAHGGNVVEFTFDNVSITLIYDENADRMRLVSAICKESELAEGQLEKAMQANFHSALDARYCISNDVVWSAFIHPLSDLSSQLLRSAIRQVAIAKLSFGDQYTSGFLRFGG